MDFVIGLIPREVAFAFSAVAESLNVTVQGTLAVGCPHFFFPFLFKNFWLPAFYAYLLLLSCRANDSAFCLSSPHNLVYANFAAIVFIFVVC